MRKLDAHHQLLEKVAGVRLGQPRRPRPRDTVGEHPLKHVPARRVLHHDGQVAGREEDFDEADDVRVGRAQAVVEDLAEHGLVHARPAVQELDGDVGARLGVQGQVDKAKGALVGMEKEGGV